MNGIQQSNGWLAIGTMTREAELEHSELVGTKYPLLSDTSRVIADPENLLMRAYAGCVPVLAAPGCASSRNLNVID